MKIILKICIFFKNDTFKKKYEETFENWENLW